ncbi:Uncharacterised protein [Salmonella enterica subsp. enterica serovar Typhimurium str. DT104]|nr:Uncharacterised protein [Salmonella enterica subsp. enterica serovar Typhimurium str. DT104]
MDTIGPFSRFTASERPVTVQRHRPRHRIIRPPCFTGKLHIHLFVKQPPQQNDGFTRHIRFNFPCGAVYRYPRINTHLAGFRLPGEPTVLFPAAHIPHTFLADICQPVLQSGVFLAAVTLRVITAQIVPEPFVGLQLRFRFMEMVQSFMCLLDGPERTFNFTFGPCRRPGAVLACRRMRQPVNLQGLHHILEYMVFGHRSIIEVQQFRAALKRKIRPGFWGHGVKEKTQSRFRILTVHTPVFLVCDTAPVIHYAEQHQRGFAPGRIYPVRPLNMFEIGWRHIKLPTVIAVFSLKSYRRRLP